MQYSFKTIILVALLATLATPFFYKTPTPSYAQESGVEQGGSRPDGALYTEVGNEEAGFTFADSQNVGGEGGDGTQPAEINAVEEVGFEVVEGVGVITIKTTEPTHYTEIEKGEKRVGIKLENVLLPQEFRVSRDVMSFDSKVSFISTFEDPAKIEDVIVIVEFKEAAPYKITQDGDTVVINVGLSPGAEEMLAEGGLKKEEKLWAFDYRFAPASGEKKEYRGQLVSFDFKDADVRDVLRILADISGFNFVIARGVGGTVTLKLINVPWDLALDIILEDAALGAEVEGTVIKVAPLATLQARQADLAKTIRTQEETEPLTNKQLFINYAVAEDVRPLAEPLLSSRGEIRIDTRTNSLLVTDTVGRIAQIENLVNGLDTITPQVLIESRVVQATLDFTRELGVQWGANFRASAATGNPTGATFPSSVQVGGVGVGNPGPFGTIGDNFLVDLPAAVGQGAGGALGIVLGSLTGAFDLDIRLSALENRGDGRVLSSPKVLTLDNQEARVEQGVSIPFLSVSAAGTQTQFVDATLRLEVTPHVTNDSRVSMKIRVTDNAPDPAITGANGTPAIRRNEAETQVLARDGETIVIGGIFTRTTTENKSSIPWFNRIPLLSFLFEKTSHIDQRRELLVFITPRIIR